MLGLKSYKIFFKQRYGLSKGNIIGWCELIIILNVKYFEFLIIKLNSFAFLQRPILCNQRKLFGD